MNALSDAVRTGAFSLEFSTLSLICMDSENQSEESLAIEIRAMAEITTKTVYVFEDPDISS